MQVNKVLNRRSLLSTVAVLAGAIALAGCSSDQIASAEASWNSVVSAIQSGVAKAAAYIPTIESIVATAASLFGPGYAAIVQVGTAAFNQVLATLVNVLNSASTPIVASARRRLMASSPQVPVVIGVTPMGIQVAGYRV